MEGSGKIAAIAAAALVASVWVIKKTIKIARTQKELTARVQACATELSKLSEEMDDFATVIKRLNSKFVQQNAMLVKYIRDRDIQAFALKTGEIAENTTSAANNNDDNLIVDFFQEREDAEATVQ